MGFPTLAQLVITEESMKNHSDHSTAQHQWETPVATNKISFLKLTLKMLKFVQLALILLDLWGLGPGGFVIWEQLQDLIQALLDCIE